jgi:translation initiation factor IF-1
VNSVNSVDNSHKATFTVECEHRKGMVAYIRNNAVEGPPVVFIDGYQGPIVVTLTNQTFYVRCPECFKKIRRLVGTRD